MSKWISVEERLPEPEQVVLVLCETRPNSYKYQCLAFYVPEKWWREESNFCWDYECCSEYVEEADDYYVNEGWYERIYNWDDYNAVGIGDFVTHWMPLPEPPVAAAENAMTTATLSVSERVSCADCKHLMYSDCYGECGAGHRGIVRPDDTCLHGERRGEDETK